MKLRLILLLLISAVFTPACFAENPHILQQPEVKVGAIHSITGFGAIGGKPEQMAVQIAADEINAAGGISGRKLKIIFEDNQSDFTKTATAFKKLADVDGVQVVLGPNWAEFSEIVAPLAQSSGVVMLSASGYTPELVVKRPYVFTLMPAENHAVRPLIKLISRDSPKKIAMLSTHNAFFELISNISEQMLNRLGLKIWKRMTFNPENRDYRSAIARLKKENVDAVILYLLEGGLTSAFLRQARELKLESKIYSGPSLPYDDIVLKHPEIAEGVFYFDYVVNASDTFFSKYRKIVGEEPKLGTAKAYDSVYIIKAAMEKCGFSAEQVRKCLSSINYQGLAGKIQFTQDGNYKGRTDITRLMQVKSGKFIRITG